MTGVIHTQQESEELTDQRDLQCHLSLRPGVRGFWPCLLLPLVMPLLTGGLQLEKLFCKVKPRRKVTLTCFRAPSGPKEQDRGLSSARTLLRVEDEDFWSEAEGDPSCCVSESIMEQINGSLQMEHALLFTFLDASSDCQFRDQLHSLHSPQIMSYQGSDDDELQTDGNRSGHFQNGELELSPTNEEVIRIIAAQLAEIGDQFDKEIQARVVTDLVQYFVNERLSREEITLHLSRAVNELLTSIPSDMAQEKAMLVLSMVLTKKIVNTVPSLLRRVYDATVNYMNQQFHDYIVEMLGE